MKGGITVVSIGCFLRLTFFQRPSDSIARVAYRWCFIFVFSCVHCRHGIVCCAGPKDYLRRASLNSGVKMEVTKNLPKPRPVDHPRAAGSGHRAVAGSGALTGSTRQPCGRRFTLHYTVAELRWACAALRCIAMRCAALCCAAVMELSGKVRRRAGCSSTLTG